MISTLWHAAQTIEDYVHHLSIGLAKMWRGGLTETQLCVIYHQTAIHGIPPRRQNPFKTARCLLDPTEPRLLILSEPVSLMVSPSPDS